MLLGVGPSQSVEYVFGDEGPKSCWHTLIFNPLKCYVLKITKKKKTVDFDYNINGQSKKEWLIHHDSIFHGINQWQR
jgi:hypothetical protein